MPPLQGRAPSPWLWYDEGIEGGTEWRDVVQRHVQDCTVFLPFITVDFCESRNCRSELFIAYDDGKTIIPIYLEQLGGSDMKNGLRTALPYKQGIYRYEMPDNNTFYARLASFSAFDQTKECSKSDLDDTLAGPDATALAKEISKEIVDSYDGHYPTGPNDQYLELENALPNDKTSSRKRILHVGIAAAAFLVICALSVYFYVNYKNITPEPPNPSSNGSDEKVEVSTKSTGAHPKRCRQPNQWRVCRPRW